MLSAELRFLIECCKISLLQSKNTLLIEIVESRTINWQRLQKMIALHSIRPTVYHALKTIKSDNIDADFFSQLNQEVKVKSAHNIFLSAEINRIQTLFAQHQIAVIPYKGLTWSQLLYKKIFREGVDMDFLIDKNKAFDALQLLKDDGYQINHLAEGSKNYQPEELLKLLLKNERVEISLIKANSYHFIFNVDLHWDLLIKPHAYGFDTYRLFTNQLNEQEKLLLLIILHNGKKEVWSKLKYICDLLLFVQEYGRDFNWDSFIDKLNHPSMEKALLKGLTLLNLFLPTGNTIILSRKLPKADVLNIYFWEKALRYEKSLLARFYFVRLKFRYHHRIKETAYYLKHYLSYLSYPTPQANRLIQFPPSYKLLNLSSTIISYLYFSMLRKKN
jgi:hypothetical protein